MKTRKSGKSAPLLRALALGCLLAAAGCGRAPAGGPGSAEGPRLVSLAPSVTETLVDLGLAGHVIGVTRQDPWLEKLPRAELVGLYVRPNAEKILSLEPDLVFFDHYPGQEDLRGFLRAAGIGVETFATASLEDIFRMVERLGEATGREDRAREIAGQMRRALGEAAAAAAGREPVTVYVEIAYNPIFTAGGNTFVNELIEAAGGVNIARDLPGDYPRISPEFVISRRPEAIILPGMAGEWLEEMVTRPGWETIPAVRENRIFSDTGTHPVTVPSPRLLTETLPALARFLAGN